MDLFHITVETFAVYVFRLVYAQTITLMPKDYGDPIKPFQSKSKTFELGQTIWANKFWGI